MIRASFWYALVDGQWLESARSFDGSFPGSGVVPVYLPGGNELTPIPAASVEGVQRVTAHAQFRGHWFEVDWLQSTPYRAPLDEVLRGLNRGYVPGRIRGAVPIQAPGVFVSLVYRGRDPRAVEMVRQVTGIAVHPGYEDVTLTVPAVELQAYREDVTDLTQDEG